MKEWEFYYTETNYGVIAVEAKTEKQAQKLAQKCVNEGDVSWGDSEHELELAQD